MERKIGEIIGKIIEFILIGTFALICIYGVFNFFRFFFLLKDYLRIN